MSYRINRRCTLCKACVDPCPTKSILLGEGQYVIDSDTCEECGICVSLCQDHAIFREGDGQTNLRPSPTKPVKVAKPAPIAKPTPKSK